MKTHGTILAFLIMMIFSSNSLAQFDLGEKIKKKIDKELNKAADDAIDETVDAVKKGGKDKDEEKDTKDAKTNNNSGNQTKIENPAKINTSGETLRKETSGALSFEGRVVFDVEEKGNNKKLNTIQKIKDT